MKLLDQLPDNLKEKAVSLRDAGLSGVAWHVDDPSSTATLQVPCVLI
jgi:hypothetical protein